MILKDFKLLKPFILVKFTMPLNNFVACDSKKCIEQGCVLKMSWFHPWFHFPSFLNPTFG